MKRCFQQKAVNSLQADQSPNSASRSATWYSFSHSPNRPLAPLAARSTTDALATPRLPRPRLSTAINLASMTDPDDLNDDFPVINGVHNPIVADAQSVRRFSPRKLLAGAGSWLNSEGLNRIDNTSPGWRAANGFKLLHC